MYCFASLLFHFRILELWIESKFLALCKLKKKIPNRYDFVFCKRAKVHCSVMELRAGQKGAESSFITNILVLSLHWCNIFASTVAFIQFLLTPAADKWLTKFALKTIETVIVLKNILLIFSFLAVQTATVTQFYENTCKVLTYFTSYCLQPQL